MGLTLLEFPLGVTGRGFSPYHQNDRIVGVPNIPSTLWVFAYKIVS